MFTTCVCNQITINTIFDSKVSVNSQVSTAAHNHLSQ